jgi:hypothetical protein
MAHRLLKPLSAALFLVLSVGLLVGAGPATPAPSSLLRSDYLIGGQIRPGTGVVTANEQVTITVSLSESAQSDEQIPVSVSDSTVFTSYPSYVTIPAGSSQASFTVTVVSDPPVEGITLGATIGGTNVYAPMAVETIQE